MTAPAESLMQGGTRARPAFGRFLGLAGLLPFGLFVLLFLLLPVSFLVVGSFQDLHGQPTLKN